MAKTKELGRPAQVFLCIISEGNEVCPNIAYKDGKCVSHYTSEKYEETRQLIMKSNEELSQKEKLRIANLIQTNPKIYKVNPSEKNALNKPYWIWNEHGNYYGQFDEKGHEVIRCECSGCNVCIDHQLTDKQKENRHCIYCRCSGCVCEARNKTNRVPDNHPLPAYWDNACRGSCESCGQIIEDSEACVIF